MPDAGVGLLMIAGGARRRRLRVAARPRRRHPHRAPADARLRPAPARGRRRQPGRGDHDQLGLGERLPRAPCREPAARDEPRAVHGVRGDGRRPHRVQRLGAGPRRTLHGPARVHRDLDGPTARPPRACGARPGRWATGPGPGGVGPRRRSRPPATRPIPRRTRPAPAGDVPEYAIRHMGRGIAGSLFAGVVSALLGIGGGLVKVPVMNLGMGVPLRVATATSNLMIGITASASAIIYLLRGGIDPYVAGPTAVGVFVGATIGSRTAHRVDVRVLRILFVGVLLFTAWQMAGTGARMSAAAGPRPDDRPAAHRRHLPERRSARDRGRAHGRRAGPRRWRPSPDARPRPRSRPEIATLQPTASSGSGLIVAIATPLAAGRGGARRLPPGGGATDGPHRGWGSCSW